MTTKAWDVFISHATEDKETFVAPLAQALRAAGLTVWYDDFELRWGDSLREKIEYGLANSRYGIVVLSSAFAEKRWTNQELNALIGKEVDGVTVILPVWHQLSPAEVRRRYPILADRKALRSETGIETIVNEVFRVLQQPTKSSTLVEYKLDALQRIRSAVSTSATELDLSNLGLRSVPPEVGSVNTLEVLDLSYNPILTLPEEVANLKKLRVLRIISDAWQQSQVFELPRWFTTLGNLEEIYLNGLILCDLPFDIEKLTRLRKLYCGKRQLPHHSQRGNTVELTPWAAYNFSSQTNLRDLPSRFGDLVELRELDLSGNALRSLPADFERLINLEILDLYQNKLTNVDAICQLRNLKELVLVANPLGLSDKRLASVRDPAAILRHVKRKISVRKRRNAKSSGQQAG